MAKLLLTIDFKGLCAFVTDTKDPRRAKELHVLMVDTEKALPGKLCPHHPMVVFRGKEDFRTAEGEDQFSFNTIEEKDFGFWMVGGKNLVLDQIKPGTTKRLKISKRFSEVLSMGRINGGDGQVDSDCVNGSPFPAVSARLKIDHGRVTAFRWSDTWGLATSTNTPGSNDWMRFHQVVRWRVYGKPESSYLRLAVKPSAPNAEPDEWVGLKRGAHIVICNLCPLSAAGGGQAKDLLAYYALCESPVPEDRRYVLHPRNQPTGLAGAGEPVRPGVDACPPLSGYLTP